jgi:DNA-binding XRE family transcriptional regulator
MDLSPLLLTGKQLRQARLIAGLERSELAELADVSLATIQAIEVRQGPCGARVPTLLAILRVLEGRGVTFKTNGGISVDPTEPKQSVVA